MICCGDLVPGKEPDIIAGNGLLTVGNGIIWVG